MEYIEQIDEYDDLDILELIMADSSSTNQYLVFEGSNSEKYAINVSKVVEILTYKDLNMVKNHDKSIIRGTAKIREEMATIINFDEWFYNDVLEDNEYEYIILTAFGGYNLGIMIKNVEHIVTIDSDYMKDNSMNNVKTNFIAEIKINNKNKLCTIFDCDKMLLDTFDDIYKKNELKNVVCDKKFRSDKKILFADDSTFIRNIVESLFVNLGISFISFENGQKLFEKLKTMNPHEIGLIITDLEMPVMDGKHLIKAINELNEYDTINIIVHTNMSSFIVENSLIELGVDEVISKIDMNELSRGIVKYYK